MYVEKALDDFGKFIVQQAKSNLSKKKHRDTGKLHGSLKYRTKKSKNSIELSIFMEDYGTFLDKGVRGFRSSARAPKSPYRFGTGTGKTGGLTKGIDRWVARKRFQFRDKKGRFLSYEQTAFTIRNSIWNKGLRATEFYSRPLELAFKKLPKTIVKAYGLDLDRLLDDVLNN